jgi:hypothetical protein
MISFSKGEFSLRDPSTLLGKRGKGEISDGLTREFYSEFLDQATD